MFRFRGSRRSSHEVPRVASRLDTLCEFAPKKSSQDELVLWFLDLLAWVRPVATQSVEVRLRYLAAQLERHPEWRENVAGALSRLVASCDVVRFLAYAGIPRDFHLSGALTDWAASSLLPAACDTHDGAQILSMALRPSDEGWIRQMDGATWLLGLVDPALHDSLTAALAQSLVDLSHEIVSQAHSPALRELSDVVRSPFNGLYEVVVSLNSLPEDAARLRGLTGRLTQCAAVVDTQREGLAQRGASMNTTFQLLRLRRQLKRLALLAALRQQPSPAMILAALGDLSMQAVRGAAGARLLRGSADLLIQNLVDTSASVGRDYLASAESSTWRAFKAGAGGGALMAVATGTKFLLGSLHLPKLYEGVVYSLNYAAVFCAAYFLHCTIATKLPAHTAAALARGVQQGGSYRERLQRFIDTWRTMVRLQLVGLLGNVLIVGPLAAALALAFRGLFQRDLLSLEKASAVVDAHSLWGPSVLFAAVTGVLLWLSSLVGSFVDNWTRVTRLADRLATRVGALRKGAPQRARARAEKITSMAGGVAANATLGFMLGGLPTMFAIAEVPLEIRHVTVSVGSLAMAWIAGVTGPHGWLLALLGALAIGLTNVVVSFSLALWFALLSTRGLAGDNSSSALVKVGIRRWSRALVRLGPSSRRVAKRQASADVAAKRAA